MLKQFAWFIFKSPQRRWIGWGTLWTDFTGFLYRIFYPAGKEMVWICVGNYNRSESLLRNLVQSMGHLQNKENFGLSIVDCNSTDVKNLEQEIQKIWKGKLIIGTSDLPFSRAPIFNLAINQSQGNLVFVCDADIQLPENIFDLIQRNVKPGSAWFPVCEWQIEENSSQNRWFTEGTGLFAATKNQLQKTGLYDEKFTEWGKEDWDLFFRLYKYGIAPFRSRCKGLRHVWHAPSKPDNFVKMF